MTRIHEWRVTIRMSWRSSRPIGQLGARLPRTNDRRRCAVKVQGRCHCGAITYEAEVAPGTNKLCHCLSCQLLTCSLFRANIAAAEERLIITAGQRRYYVNVAGSATRRHAS